MMARMSARILWAVFCGAAFPRDGLQQIQDVVVALPDSGQPERLMLAIGVVGGTPNTSAVLTVLVTNQNGPDQTFADGIQFDMIGAYQGAVALTFLPPLAPLYRARIRISPGHSEYTTEVRVLPARELPAQES